MPAKDYNNYMKRYMLDRYYRRRQSAIEQLGSKCVKCGSTENLDFDHKERTRKGWTIAKYLVSASEKRLQEELHKCQLLCRKCHKDKTALEPTYLNERATECCGQLWKGHQYAGHRGAKHSSRRSSSG